VEQNVCDITNPDCRNTSTRKPGNVVSHFDFDITESYISRFQWAYVQIKQLLELHRPSEIVERLGKLPKDLKLTYDEIYNGMKEHERQVADRAFQWVMCACHPLKTKHLLPAVCQDENNDALLPLDGLDEDLLLEYCHNLLIIDPVRQVWIPSHLSVIEYFENHLWSQSQANYLVSSACLLVLQDAVRYNREESWGLGKDASTDEYFSSEWESISEDNSTNQGDSIQGEDFVSEDYSSREDDSYLKDDMHNPSSSIELLELNDPLYKQDFRDFNHYARHHWTFHVQACAGTGNTERLSVILDRFLGEPTNSSLAYRCWLRMTAKEEYKYEPHTFFFNLFHMSPDTLSGSSIACFAYCAFDLALILPNCR
jgi:ankyrin repeat domain-containing protein 50